MAAIVVLHGAVVLFSADPAAPLLKLDKTVARVDEQLRPYMLVTALSAAGVKQGDSPRASQFDFGKDTAFNPVLGF